MMKGYQICHKVVKLIASWLEERRAVVVVDGTYSEEAVLKNMVFQGTVWGPPLCNAFYGDARKTVADAGFTEVVYAEDLNAYKSFPTTAQSRARYQEARQC